MASADRIITDEQYQLALEELAAYDGFIVNTNFSPGVRGTSGIFAINLNPPAELRDFFREAQIPVHEPGEVSTHIDETEAQAAQPYKWDFHLKDIPNRSRIVGVRLSASETGEGGIIVLENNLVPQTAESQTILERYRDHKAIAVDSPLQPLLRQLVCSATEWTRNLFGASRGTDAVFTDPYPWLVSDFYAKHPDLRPVVPQKPGRRY